MTDQQTTAADTAAAIEPMLPPAAPDIASCPPDMMDAIFSVIEATGTLGKDGSNVYDKYDYASIDQFLAAVRGPMAKAKLFPHCTVDGINWGEKKGKGTAIIKYRITLLHPSGALTPMIFSVEVNRTGPQAFGAAQAYALKFFLRSVFLIPTGDEDADAQPKEGSQSQQQERQQQYRDPHTDGSGFGSGYTQSQPDPRQTRALDDTAPFERQQQPPQQQGRAEYPPLTVAEQNNVLALMEQAQVTQQQILEAFNLARLADMRLDLYERICRKLRSTIERNAQEQVRRQQEQEQANRDQQTQQGSGYSGYGG